MYLLDTDHLSLIDRGSVNGERIVRRLSELPPAEIVTSVINYEEQMRGWLAEIAATPDVSRQKTKYTQLTEMLSVYCTMNLLPFDDRAVATFQNLWLRRLRIGTMDLKIAAIALANDATVLTERKPAAF